MACYAGAGDRLLRQPPAAAFLDDRSGRVSGSNHLHSLAVSNIAAKSNFSRISTSAKSNAGVSDHPVAKSASYFVDSSAAEGIVNGEEYDCPAVKSNASVSDHPVAKSASYFIDSGVDLVLDEGIVNGDEYDCANESPRVSKKLDEWMRNSVTEIVKNIEQAPLLVQIYADGEVRTEKAAAADWPDLVRDKSSQPDGIILVEELREERNPADSDGEFDGTKAFGVLIQGRFKGNRCKSTCYLLKTSRVNGGLGVLCTHFCLMKIKSFRDSAFSQLNDCWLLP